MAYSLHPQLPAEPGFQPGTLTAVVSPAGLMNLALVMPMLLKHIDHGHKLGVVGSESGSPSTHLASAFDFVAARGPKALDDLIALMRMGVGSDEAQLSEALGDGLIKAIFRPRPCDDSDWLSALEPDESDKPSILLVPDLQEDHVLRQWTPDLSDCSAISYFDVMPAQLAGLRALSRRGGLAVVGGHCASHERPDSWRVVAEIADQTIVVRDRGEVRPGGHAVELSYYSRGSATTSPDAVEERIVDLRFAAWRQARPPIDLAA
ncbi:MAG TPA: hypothetical protein VFJ57_16550 [Solirubrobacterales bacterium]|nr:hypothetical protein [Solirubrobacterales bacterium]